MFKKTIKKKLHTSFVLFLTLIIAMGVFPASVFAATGPGGDTGVSVGGGGSNVSTQSGEIVQYYYELGLKVFLYKGVNSEFLLTNENLGLSVSPTYGDAMSSAAYKEQMAGRSITNAYYQIFGRTMINGNASMAKDSLVILGAVHDEKGAGKINYGGYDISTTYEEYASHAVLSYGKDGTKRINLSNRDGLGGHKDSPNSYGAFYHGNQTPPIPYGEGVYNQRIFDFLNEYFSNPTSPTQQSPRAFIESLVLSPSDADMKSAFNVWAYIADGVQFKTSGRDRLNEGAAIRWRQMFLSNDDKDYLSWDDVFLGNKQGDDVDPILYEKDGTGVSPLKSWKEDERIFKQVAAYLDSLLSMAALMTKEATGDASISAQERNTKLNIAKMYTDAAIYVFEQEAGKAVTVPENMKPMCSIVLGTATLYNMRWRGEWRQGIVGDYIDFWSSVIKDGYSSVSGYGGFSNDLRHNSNEYNDVNGKYYSLESSPNYNASGGTWFGIGPATSDRIAARISMFTNSSPNFLSNKNVDGSVPGGMFPASWGLGPTSNVTGSRLTTSGAISQTVRIGAGLTQSGHISLGLSSNTTDYVMGQFVIGMFAHAGSPISDKFTHSITAKPDTEEVTPNSSGVLNRTPRISYRYGTTFTDVNGVRVAASNQTDAQSYSDMFEAKLKENGGQIEARTYLTRQITEYKLFGRYVSGDPAYPAGGNKAIPVSVNYSEESIVGERTNMGYLTVSKDAFNSPNTGFAAIESTVLKAHLLSSNNVLIDFDDTQLEYALWAAVEAPETVEISETQSTIYVRGASYVLKVTYRADTELRLNYGGGSYWVQDYSSNASDVSVARAKTATGATEDKLPVFLSQSSPGVLSPVEDSVRYYYELSPSSKTVTNLKERLAYAVYSSSPEAYAELKNWGVATRNEPGDDTNRGDNVPLGDGRSPVDTGAGVSESFRSDGAQLITEDYEVMAGVPTTEKLYLAVGGSEFIVDIAVQYVPNETAVRTYHSRFNGVLCQHYWNGASGTASGQSDTPNDAHWTAHGQIPQPSGASGATVTGTPSHNGFTITYTASGQVDSSGSAVKTGGAGSASGDSHSLSVNSPGICGDTTSGKVDVTPLAADVARHNAVMADVEKWIGDMQTWITGIQGFTSTSDTVTRRIGTGEVGTWTFGGTKNNTGVQSSSVSFSISAPSKLWEHDDGRGQSGGGVFNVVTFAQSESLDLTNMRNLSASASSSCYCSCPSGPDDSPCGHCGDNPGSSGDGQSIPQWSVTVSFTIAPHVICGPCCGHQLPEINDIWQQSYNYDYLKIIGLSVLRLDQGSAADLSPSQNGLAALIGVPKLGVTRQTFYSSPSYNMAQANIFNYMGLQTDGTKNVNDATNEYLRSIAYGRTVATSASSNGNATSYGQTYSSEAGRVRYWLTNANGSQITSKGVLRQRAEYQGNSARSSAFANEISLWDSSNGLFNAHDYVLYNFGNRSNICDGTSRGYTYNLNKRQWIELVPNSSTQYRGRAAHAVSWGNGFIYDGIESNGLISMTGYSATRQYRNTGTSPRFGGIIQDTDSGRTPRTAEKGWNGRGIIGSSGVVSSVIASTPGGANTVKSYDDFAEERFRESPWWITGSQPALRTPIIRDWNWEVSGSLMMSNDVFSAGFHNPYRDTRVLRGAGGTTWPGGERGDIASRSWAMYNWYKVWGENPPSMPPDNVASTGNPYNTNEGFLRAYTNTANDGGTRNRNTQEYQLMYEKRTELVQATVISDALVLELPNGNQPIVYHYKNAAYSVRADSRLPDTRVTFDETWGRNPFAAGGWLAASGVPKKDAIILGGYNGVLGGATSTQDLQSRFHWKADEVPTTPVGLFFTRSTAVELPTGDIGRHFGAKELHNTNINRYMGHNAETRILSTYILSEKAASPTNRTMLYNVSPIVLSAQNQSYTPGSAEAFWESIMLWKDSSNHDYYDRYVQTGVARGVYLAETQFVRMEELLNNYGNVLRDTSVHTADNADTILSTFFYDSRNMEALGASQARGAQTEQYVRGFGITNYNYNDKSMYSTKTTTPDVTVDGKLHTEVYNESADLTGVLKGKPYGVSSPLNAPNARQLGIPFILDTVYEATFNSITAMNTASQRHIGNLRADTPKSGYIQQAAYLKSESEVGLYQLNGVIIHTPVTARPVQLMPLADWRDQRVFGQSQVALIRESERVGCPGTVALCQFAAIACSYGRTLEYLNLDFTSAGTANQGLSLDTVKNTGANATPQGNIILAGSYRRSATGLTSGGSARTGIQLSSVGASYQSSMNFRVTATGVTFTPTTGTQREQMLFGFAGYGITLDTQTGELYIRMSNSAGYLKVNGTLASSSTNTLVVEFSMSNASTSRVWINGTAYTLSPVGVSTSTMTIGSGQVGDVFYIGAWNTSGYTPAASTRLRTIRLEQLAGSTSHSLSCSSEVMRHIGGYNGHVHSTSCLGSSTSNSYLSGTLKDWAAGRIDDAELEKRLGSSVYNALKTKIEASSTVFTFNYSGSSSSSGSVQTFNPSRSGVYKLEVWGAQGGGSYGGKGGYASGDALLTGGVPIYIAVGGQGSIAGSSVASVPGGYTCNGLPLNAGGGFYDSGARCSGCGGCVPCHICGGSIYGHGGTAPNNRHDHNGSCGYRQPTDAGYSGSGGGGWNGGGNGYSKAPAAGVSSVYGYGGGGATHIALTNGLLKDVPNDKILIVAGGGGGTSNTNTGGAGGGANGGNGSGGSSPAGGTPSGGNAKGTGGNAPSAYGGGGGGGWFGGRAAATSAGAGGSGYRSSALTKISTYSTPMQSDIRSGNGMARITLERGYIEHGDVLGLANELWKTIPDYMDDAQNERNPVWSCNFEANQHVCIAPPNPNACYYDIDYTSCKEPHHNGQHYAGSSICFQPCMNDNLHDSQFVQDRNVNTAAAEWVSIDWDYTLYAGTIDNTFRSTPNYQLSALSASTGRGYYDQNSGGEFDTVKFVRGKYVKFPWYTLYDGVLYSPGKWIVLGERGDYQQGYVSNVKDGTYGNMQGSASGTNNVWNGQAAAYNVKNWSLYNQKIYHDLYKDFYDFYVPLANAEVSAEQVIYATVTVNAHEGRAGSDSRVTVGLPYILNNEETWRAGGRVNNHQRVMHATPHGASKQFRVDLVGRIGGYVIQDTTDVKFSTTMKDIKAVDPMTTSEFILDMSNLTSPHTLMSGIAQRLPKTDSLPDRVGLSSLGDWAGFDFDGDNNRQFTITVTGNYLKSGELEVLVGDPHNGDYIIRMSDMTVIKTSDTMFSVQFEVKPSEASISLNVRYRLIDQSVDGVYVDKMAIQYGGAGYSHGLAQTVDSDVQNYYVTDLVDVRGVYIGRTQNYLGFPSEGHAASGQDWPDYDSWVSNPNRASSNPNNWGVLGAYLGQNGHTLLEWYRYASDYSERYNSHNPFNWIRISDATQVRGRDKVRVSTNPDGSGVLSQEYDVSTRETPIYGTRSINTFGTRTWVSDKDPMYLSWKANGGRALHGPLSSEYNVIEQYRTPNDQVSVGAKILFDVTTLGNYWSADSRLEIIPTYYAVGLQRNADGSTETNFNLRDSCGYVTLTPVNVYQMTSSGEYAEVNIFGAPYGSFSNAELDEFNRYRLDVNWENEAVNTFNRRNVTDREHRAARQYADLFRMDIYEKDAYYLSESEEPGEPIGMTESWRLWPRGILPIGGSQLISQDYKTQTYIGTNRTYGVDKSGGLFDGLSGSNLYSHPRYIIWELSAQRWHTALGLPSDSMFVALGNPCSCGHCSDYELCRDCVERVTCSPRSDYTHPSKADIQAKAIDLSKTTVIAYLDIFSYGDIWTLRYGSAGLQRSMTIDGVEYLLPIAGPAGPGQTQGYSGDSSPGLEYNNPGIPFALFGGSKVSEMADIIKVN